MKRPFDRLTQEWIASLSPEQRKRLSDKGLIEPDEPEEKEVETLLSDYLDEYFESRSSDVKPSTRTFYNHTKMRLKEYFPGRTLRSITPSEGKAFRKWMEESSNKRDTKQKRSSLAPNTVRRRIGLCRQVFKQAIEDGVADRNPFLGMSTAVRSNKERKHYIDLATFAKVLEKAPNARWRALLVLSRIGAVRVPSEIAKLKWEHINFEKKRIFIVDSSKTEHHANRKLRVIPMLPQIEKELLALHLEAEEGEEEVFPSIRPDSNLRTGLARILLRAGVKQWPKLWHNLRASGATDFARSLPSHVASEICGHSEEVAKEHYWQVSDSDLESAIDKLGGEIAHNIAHNNGVESPSTADGDSETDKRESTEAVTLSQLSSILRLMAESGFGDEVGDARLELATPCL
ncbi:MAG: tyrosine-type recombinase/integrase [Aureliella sp.]